MTIGDQFQLSGYPLESIVQEISHGKFDVSYLENFGYRDELRECCIDAVEAASTEEFEFLVSNARIMGDAMELLRERYGANVPRGWYPVMKRLRAISAEEQECKTQSKQKSKRKSEEEPEQDSEEQQRFKQESKVQLEYERQLLAWHAAGKPLEDFHDQFVPSPEYEAVWRDMQYCRESLREWEIWAVKSGELQRLGRHRGFVP